jgi:mycothiol synthase
VTTTLSPAPPQLRMVWPHRRPEGPALRAVPAGYTVRAYRRGDTAAYVRLMQRAGFSNWSEAKAQGVFDTMYPDALFFIVHDASSDLVCTAAAQNKPDEYHPQGGEMGWVATDPDHRGKGLSYITVSLATRRLLAEDRPSVFLKTDDFRLPAIRVYVNLGFVPFLYLPEMEERWRAVAAALGLDYASLSSVTDPAGNNPAARSHQP